MKIHWQPTPAQTKALLADVDELLYGGARGGGKTDAGMVWLIEPHYISNPKYRALVIRKNSDDLRDWVDRARSMYAPLNAQFRGNPTEILFPSGAIVRTGHLKDEGAYTKYQGHEYQKMLIEELTKISRQSDYEKLLGSCRSTVPGLKAKVMATTNPDGDGHEWVKERWQCENPSNEPIQIFDTATGLTRTRLFVPARVEDNPHLMGADPGYVAYLNSIADETLRRQWREGSWEEPNIEGAYYKNQISQADKDGRITDVPYEPALTVDVWFDLGMSDAMSIWFTQNDGLKIRVIDYLEAEGEGLEYYKGELNKKGYSYGGFYFPHDIEVRELGTGVSRKEKAEKLGFNPLFVVQKLEIADGIEAVRTIFPRLWFDKTKCKEGLVRLKNYQKEFDEKRNIYKDRPVHDWASHGADAFRYMAVGQGQYKQIVQKQPKRHYQPMTRYGG